jgi:hypothetical protein
MIRGETLANRRIEEYRLGRDIGVKRKNSAQLQLNEGVGSEELIVSSEWFEAGRA